jgi:glycosyltransferase involved in cell wall biosynthesis
MPLKSVHITNYYHKNSGGISTSFNNLMAAAERHRRHVRLIVPGEAEAQEQVNEFARIYYVPAKYSPVFDKRYRLIMPWQYMKPDSIIRRILTDEMPDIVEVTDKYTLSMFGAMVRRGSFREINRPMLVHFSCERMDDNIESFLSKGRFGKWLAKSVIGNYTLPSFDFHIANSTYTAEEFSSSLDGRSRWFLNFCWRFFKSPRVPVQDRVRVCPRGVDAAQFSPARRSDAVRGEMIARSGATSDSTLLLYAGRISPEKNIGLLVEMMRLLATDRERDYRLLIAGAGPQADWLAEETQKHYPGKVIQLGHVDKDLLAGFYANADVFVHPNPREPFGIAPLEAMASGVATLAPSSGGILSYANNENAWLVEPTGDAFAEAVRDIMRDDAKRERKIQNAVETARSNTREASTDNLFATYDEIYEQFRSRHDQFTNVEAADNFDFARLLHA